VVLASEAATAGTLLRPLAPPAADILDTIESASLTVLNLAYRAEDVGHDLRGYGFLVPRNEPDFPLMGVLWADSAFPHHGRDGHRLIRVFVGGTRMTDVNDRSDENLLDTAQSALRNLLQISGAPTDVDVCRYPAAIPQYHLGYKDKIARLREQLTGLPDLYLAGNYLEGVSVNDCVRLGTQVAAEVARDAGTKQQQEKLDASLAQV
jgi:oxygen-dependent protoporphyrinogen oxidase